MTNTDKERTRRKTIYLSQETERKLGELAVMLKHEGHDVHGRGDKSKAYEPGVVLSILIDRMYSDLKEQEK